ncbi:MAG: hypothetical protein J0L73_07050 [Verrucomicrobia bacterium]|nr:hypothetical protein [Verrucomicrobiota bacterium]
MTRARWLLSAASLSALWLLGALVWLPHLSRDLKAAAQDVLSQQPALQNRLGGLNLEFDGRQARLSGSVRTLEDRRMAENAVREGVRLPAPLSAGLGRHLNPVSDVLSEVEVIPSPPGWMLLAADGAHARLLGTAANSYEARDLARSVQEAWNLHGGMSEGMPGIDAENHDEAASVSTTLRTVPAPQSSVQACLVRIGQAWKELTLNRSDAELQTEAYAMGVTQKEWREQVRPALHELRATLQRQRQAQEEGERLARLPPGYLFIAVRDQQIILRGEVGTEAMKRGILEDALATFAPRRLHDEIRVSAQSRPSGDFGPITTALLPQKGKDGGKSCFLGFSGGAWKRVDWQITPREQSWKSDLPSGLDARLVQNDGAMLSNWLQGDEAQSPAPSQRADPAFITLALFGTKAILSGQVAEEAVRTQLIAAVRQAYSPRFFISSDDVHVRGDCEPSSGILNTLKSLPPPPAADSAGMFAIAKPGGAWTLIPVTRELVEAGGLAKSSLLPAGIPAGAVEELSAEAIEQLRLHLAHPAFP